MTEHEDAIDVADALLGGPKTCSHCNEEMTILLQKKITTKIPQGLAWDPHGERYFTQKGKRIEKTQYICCHCKQPVDDEAAEIQRDIYKYNQRMQDEANARMDTWTKHIKPPSPPQKKKWWQHLPIWRNILWQQIQLKHLQQHIFLRQRTALNAGQPKICSTNYRSLKPQ